MVKWAKTKQMTNAVDLSIEVHWREDQEPVISRSEALNEMTKNKRYVKLWIENCIIEIMEFAFPYMYSNQLQDQTLKCAQA